MEIMKKPLILVSIFVIIFVSIIVGLIMEKKKNSQKVTTMIIRERQEENNQETIKDSELQNPLYAIEIKTTPTLNHYGFTYKATLKNIDVQPFITNFGFNECNFRDSDGSEYSGSMSDNNVFEKAILPDELREFVAKDVTTNISGFDHTLEGLKKCSYNEKGENSCRLMNDLQIIDCVGYISTEGKSVGSYDGQSPIKVIFPVL